MSYLKEELYDLIRMDDRIFDFIQDAALDGLWYWDIENPENEWMNPKFWLTLGYDPEEMPHKSSAWQYLIDPDDLAVALANFKKHCENSDHPYDQIVRYRHKNESTVWIRCRGIGIRDSEGKVIRMLGAHQDITQLKETEAKLILKNSIQRSSIESFQDVLIFSIDRNYRYLIFNKAFQVATYGAYGTQVMEGTSMLDSITNLEDKEKAKHNCDLALRGESHLTIEVYGEINRSYFETRYNPILNENLEVIGVTVMSTNITERKNAEENLEALNKELESFSYSVSHDLRAPLRAINGYAHILKEDFSKNLDDEANRIIDVICKNANKMGNLIDDLLKFSRLGRKELSLGKVNMKNLVINVINDSFSEEILEKVDITIGELCSVKADNVLLEQVWVNLISNAIKYSFTKTRVKISIDCAIGDRNITYSIKDNGVGFDMKYYDKLFGVFQRLHREYEFEGTGVGLAIVKRIINRLGGKIWAEAKLNEGAIFFFSLPKLEDNE